MEHQATSSLRDGDVTRDRRQKMRQTNRETDPIHISAYRREDDDAGQDPEHGES